MAFLARVLMAQRPLGGVPRALPPLRRWFPEGGGVPHALPAFGWWFPEGWEVPRPCPQLVRLSQHVKIRPANHSSAGG